MKKLFAALVLISPFALTGCGSDDKTYVVTPPAAQAAPSSTVVVPQAAPNSTVTKICPAGASTC